MADDLYDRDFYLWTQAQAEALRAHDRAGNAIDFDRVAEEIEDLGKRDLHAIVSLTARIIEHLHKVRSSKSYEPRRHWRKEIVAFRMQVDDRLTPSLRAKLETELEKAHRYGALDAQRWMEADGVFFDPIDLSKRWTLPQILGEADDPLASDEG